jgi:hypothetical protein
MLLELTLPDGARAQILEYDGTRVVLSSTRAMPPGSTLQGSSEGLDYSVKVRSCRRQPAEATFLIEGRFVSLQRAQRARLLGQSP